MSVVFDVHAHVFPPLAEDRGGMARRLLEHQYSARIHAQGIRRTRDNSPVDKPLLAGERDSISWLPQVDYRMGRFGRVEFTHEGEDYYMQWMPRPCGTCPCRPSTRSHRWTTPASTGR